MNNHTGLKNYNNFRKLLKRYKEIKLLGPYHREVVGNDNYVDLSNNINHYLGEFAHYPDVFYSRISKVILEYVLPLYKGSAEFNLSSNNILAINGVVAAVDIIIKAFCPAGSLIVSLSPSFPAYSYYANIHHVPCHESKLFGDNLGRINTNEIIKLQPTIVFICDPNNPVGSSINDADIEELLTSCPHTLFVIDETYQEYSSKNTNITKLKYCDNLVVLRNFSKAWGLAALRIGAIISTNEIINALMRCIIPFSISALSEEEFIYSIQNNTSHISNTWLITNEEKTRVVEQMKILPNIKKIYESDTNYLCFIVHDMDMFNDKLKKCNVKVEIVDPLIPNGYRMTIGTYLENSYFISAITS